MSTGNRAAEPAVYGAYTNSFVLKKDEIIEIVLNNNDPGKHPFHLHGHAFQAVHRAAPNAGFYNHSLHHSFPNKPMRRDTLMVRPNGNFVIRFKADNPGMLLQRNM
jgi:iron transport multicopper oxidase